MVAITEFILDRIGEEEFLAEHMIRRHGARYLTALTHPTAGGVNPANPWAVLAACRRRRHLVSAHRSPQEDASSSADGSCDALRGLAAEWASHPSYRSGWAPRHRIPRQSSSADDRGPELSAISTVDRRHTTGAR